MSDLKSEFRVLKSELGKHYKDEDYKLLRFCVSDHLPLGDLTDAESIANDLFNKLDSEGGPGVITPTDVTLLLEITRLAGPKDAEHLVRQYITDNNITCTGENKLKPERERLFRAVRQSGSPAAARRVASKYRLKQYKSLWDVILELEKKLILPKELNEFASLLGERAQKELGLLSTDTLVDPATPPNESDEDGNDDHEEDVDRPPTSKRVFHKNDSDPNSDFSCSSKTKPKKKKNGGKRKWGKRKRNRKEDSNSNSDSSFSRESKRKNKSCGGRQKTKKRKIKADSDSNSDSSLNSEQQQKKTRYEIEDLDQSKELGANEGKAMNKDIATNSILSAQVNEKIEEYLMSRQRVIFECDNKEFTPSIMNPIYTIDIEQVFTELELELLKENNTIKDTPKPISSLLPIIESTDACKILIDGDAGIGKTTLLRHLAHKKFKGKIVFFLYVRDLKEGNDIYNLIEKQLDMKDFEFVTDLPQNSKLIEQFIFENDGKIVLLLDGYDELSCKNECLVDLFKKKTLGKSVVLLTSRSENIEEFIKRCNVHVRVKGFNKDSVGKYIENHFEYFGKPQLGNTLRRELEDNHLAFDLSKNPLLLLSICSIWEDNQTLPSSKADLFKDTFCCILQQSIAKDDSENKTILLKFENIPEKYVNAMVLLGKCMFDSLKKNQLLIKQDDLKANQDNETVDLALKLGFVNKKRSSLRARSESWFYIPIHKLILESLVGFYLYKSCERDDMTDECKTDVTKCEYLIRANMFAVEFLGADAGKFLKHWVTKNVSTYRPLIQNYLKCVEGEYHHDKVRDALKQHMNTIMLTKQTEISESLKVCIAHIDKKKADGGEHFIDRIWQLSMLNLNELDLRKFCNTLSVNSRGNIIAHIVYFCTPKLDLHNYNLSGDVMNDMIREWSNMRGGLIINSLNISNNNLINIDPKLLQSLMIMSPFYISFEMINCNLSGKVMNDICKSSGEDTPTMLMFTIAGNNLSDIDGTLFGIFLSKMPMLLRLDIHGCKLSGDVMNKMIRAYAGNKSQLQELCIEENDISDIDGTLLGTLLRLSSKLLKLDLHNCNLSGATMNKMIKEYNIVDESEIQVINIADNDISGIDGTLMGTFLSKSPKLRILDMHTCKLSGNVLNKIFEMYEGDELQLRELNIGNDISGIHGTVFDGYCNSPKLSINDLHDNSDINGVNSTILGGSLSKSAKLDMLKPTDYKIPVALTNETRREYQKKELELQNCKSRTNDFRDINGTLVGKLLHKSSKLSKLVMHDCKLSGRVMNEIMTVYENNNLDLQELYIGKNDISDIDGALLGTFLCRSRKLHTLSVFNCKLSGEIMNEMMREYERDELELQELYMLGNDFSSINGTLLGTFLSKCPKLIKLSMHTCNLPGTTINEAIKFYAGNNFELQELYIGGNDMRDIDGNLMGTFLSKPSKLLTLSLDNCNLSGEKMNTIITAYNAGVHFELQELYIWNNDFSDIDGNLLGTFLCKSPQLLKISLDTCKLSSEKMNTIMTAYDVGDKFALQELVISNNDFSDINGTLLGTLLCKSPHLLKLSLDTCKLSGEKMNTIITTYDVGDRFVLQELFISNNILIDINGTLLGTFLCKSPELRKLHMNNCNLSGEKMNAIMKAYEVSDTFELQELYISNNDISDVDGILLGTFLRKSPRLVILSMNDSNLSGENMNTIITAYDAGDQFELQELYISNNNFSDIDGTLMGTFLCKSPQLRKLHVHDCELSGENINKIITAYYAGDKFKLQELYICNNDFSDIDGTLLGKFLCKSPKLRKLHMNNCKLSGEKMNTIITAYDTRGKFQLQELDIRNNDISDIDGTLLGTFLCKSPQLCKLDMDNCKISGKKMNTIITAHNAVDKFELQELDIKNNDISDIDGTLLGNFLCKSSQLRKLHMNNCKLSGDKMNTIITAYDAGYHFELQELYICNNDLSDIDGTLLGNFLSKTPQLRKLHMNDCKLPGHKLNTILTAYDAGDKFELQELIILNNDLSDIDSTLLGTFFGKSPQLRNMSMHNCNFPDDEKMNTIITACYD